MMSLLCTSLYPQILILLFPSQLPRTPLGMGNETLACTYYFASIPVPQFMAGGKTKLRNEKGKAH